MRWDTRAGVPSGPRKGWPTRQSEILREYGELLTGLVVGGGDKAESNLGQLEAACVASTLACNVTHDCAHMVLYKL